MTPDLSAVTLEGTGWYECDQELLGMIMALLEENLDIAMWAMCSAGADNQMMECVEKIITGVAGKSPIEIGFSYACSGEFATDLLGTTPMATTQALIDEGLLEDSNTKKKAHAVWGGRHIEFCGDTGAWWGNAVNMYCEGDSLDAECAVVGAASTVLHEITHLCGATHESDKGAGGSFNCSIPYLTASLFTEAMMARYPRAAASECCKSRVEANPFHGLTQSDFNECQEPADPTIYAPDWWDPDRIPMPTLYEPSMDDQWWGSSGVIIDGVEIWS